MKRIAGLKKGLSAEINMTPMIDLIFLLLVFFIVTTTFTRETGVEVAKPSARTAVKTDAVTVLIALDETGAAYMDGKVIDVRSIRGRLNILSGENPDLSVMVVADRRAEVEHVVKIMDQCRLAGVDRISLSAEKKY